MPRAVAPATTGLFEETSSPPNAAAELADLLALPESQALAVGIADRLRDAILHGLFGPGEQLREVPLARSMGVSRGPVREAMTKLEREGLIVFRRNRGAFVAQLAADDLEEVYTLRLAIERLAMQRAQRRMTPERFAALQLQVDHLAEREASDISEREAADLDLQFHDLLYEFAEHRRLAESWANLRPQVQILLLNRMVAEHNFRHLLVDAHQWLIDALHSGDEARAVGAIEHHLRGSYESVVAGFRQRSIEAEQNREGAGRDEAPV